ncbi:P-loop containing nucleoside triphosphate hydrolase protein [Gorgonomyces haynaldii]|nr:P-loop containing nucleoside triphosphate hydrolase protein [Gorgonomyces haynaldii]
MFLLLVRRLHLRPYQQECIDKSLEAFKTYQRIAVSLPVGAGKTVVYLNLIQQMMDPIRTKSLVLAHRRELLFQPYRHLQSTNLKVGLEQGKTHADPDCDVILASVPTLGRLNSSRLLKFNPAEFKMVIVDEAHHVAAESYQRILQHFQVYEDNGPKLWGCSATLRRHDGLSLGPTFEHIAFERSVGEMLSDGWCLLCEIDSRIVKTTTSLDKIPTLGDDYSPSHLANRVNDEQRNALVVKSYIDIVQHERKRTLVFAVNVQHIHALCQVFADYGVDARGLDAQTDPQQRMDLLRDFQLGKFPVLINCGILTEGTDIPSIDSILLARPTKSGVLLQQMVGRGMRLHESKKDCLVVDFVDNLSKDLYRATVPTLLGLEKEDAQVPVSEKERETSERQENVLSVDLVKEHVEAIESVRLVRVSYSAPKPTCRYSDFAWIRKSKNVWLLNYKDGHLTLSKRGHLYQVDYYSKKQTPNGSKMIRKQLLQHDTLESCFQAADTLIQSSIPYFQQQSLHWNASWRSKSPTDKQIRLLRSLGHPSPEHLSKGEAADFISKRLLKS